METLFFELIQVATGQLDCLSRGPEADEWQQLYDLSKRQHIEGVCYHGVTKLFEFGLRAPQDISIDWMAETEDIREKNEQNEKQPLFLHYYDLELQPLRQSDDDPLFTVPEVTIQQMYQLYKAKKLDMRAMIDYFYTLQKTGGKYETLKGGGLFSRIGIRRFAAGMMWFLGNQMKLDTKQMPFKPLETEGRYLVSLLFDRQPVWFQFRHRMAWFQF